MKNTVIIILAALIVGGLMYYFYRKGITPEKDGLDMLIENTRMQADKEAEAIAAAQQAKAQQEAQASAEKKEKDKQTIGQVINALAFGGVGNVVENIKGWF